MLRRRLHFEWFLVAFLACLFVVVASLQSWFGSLDNRIYDLASGLAAPPADERILLVEIDEASLRELGRWPWTRDKHARALQTIARYRPAAIAYDVLFLEASPEDAELHDALITAQPIYLPGIVEDGVDRVVTPPALIATGATKVGISLLLPDSDGIVRRAEKSLLIEGRQVDQLPTFLTHGVKMANAGSLAPNERFLIAYNPNHAFRRISFASLTKGEVPANMVAGKFVLVGASAAGMGDFHSVPIAFGSRMAGVEVQANVLNTLLGGTAIATLAPSLMAAIALIPLLILLAAYLRLPPGRNLLLATGLAAGTLLLAVALLPATRLWLPPSATLVGLLLVHGLWGWRRLNAVNGFLISQADALQSEPGVLAGFDSPRVFGDVIEAEAFRLEAVISQVRKLRGFIERVIERHPDALFVVDSQDRVVQRNQAAAGLVGHAAIGQPISEVIDAVSPEAAVVGLPLRGHSGRWLLMAETTVDNRHRIVSFTDITELQRAGEERDDLLQFLSHDLRAPNAATVWLLEAEEMGGEGQNQTELAKPLRDRIQSNARHALRLADNFVQLVRARRRPLIQQPVDLCDVAREAADMVTAFARTRGATLQNNSDPGELWVLGDHGMLLRAAINLLDNAVKFAPENAVVVYAVKQTDGKAILTVVGPGPSMPQGRQEDPFALYAEGRKAGNQSSIGLGLSFVQTTAERHGGKAIYLYHEGYGAEFQMRLPTALLVD
ncbi:hypothetical protein IP81_09715 [Novosphingobium sp. AAP83]|uniref:CHASE2 domain-containing protein n=1 Tax=Novosphingobium sp. AAP83 TaxID=1523425 RepID=UPI0006B9962E|nr:CHASE2 domain-containing protein [Novosphingobium sp. AAP83]KPF91644.1 hypothetical protein IP81_09715 [Novosphingobium sp. AAP83]